LPEADADADGVHNIFDRCPTEAGATESGCPVVSAGAEDSSALDRDGDGVADAVDACPALKGTAEGCPDSDGDTIADSRDACPDAPGLATAGGCPDIDGAGVIDSADQCPTEPHLDPRGHGCDFYPPVVVADPSSAAASAPPRKFTGPTPRWVRTIPFPSGSDKMPDESRAVVDALVVLMREYPDMRVELSGHSDSRGSRDRNMAASCKRADAVIDYLVVQGIDPARTERRCAGPDEPIASNENSSGRAANRRVEVKVLP
jgi:OOP family OmpA-OmpF porin